jgi:hypothetical protein
MKKSRKQLEEFDLDVSLLLDGRADESTTDRVESAVASDPELRRRLDDMKHVAGLLRDHHRLAPNPFLTERILHRTIESTANEREHGADFGLRPIAAAVLSVLVVGLAIVGYVNRDPLLSFLSSKQTAMQNAYEDNVLKGWLMPLFGKTNKNEVLQYAMFGTLPIDRNDGTVLRVDEHSDKGYRVEFSRDTANEPDLASVEDLYQEIRPSESQRRMFDSLFHYAGRQIESAVLLDEKNQIAIDPSITRFNRVILSSIAAGLDAEQRQRFDRFLERRNTTYTLASASLPSRPQPPEEVIRSVREIPRSGTFFLVGSDTVSYATLNIDMDSLRDQMLDLPNRQRVLEQQLQRLAELRRTPSQRSYAVRIPDTRDGRVLATTYTTGDQSISLSFEGEIEELAVDTQKMRDSFMRDFVVIRRRLEQSANPGASADIRVNRDIRVNIRPDSGEMRMYFTPDSGMQMELRIHREIERSFEDMLQQNRELEQLHVLPEFRRERVGSDEPGNDKSLRELNPAIIDSILEHHRRELQIQRSDSTLFRSTRAAPLHERDSGSVPDVPRPADSGQPSPVIGK